jgi:hypothetical protein
VTIRRLTIFHEKEDKSEPRLLFDKIRDLSSLEEIHIIDADEWLDFWGDIPSDDAPNHLAHRLLDVVLDAHASRLRTIVLFGVTPMTIGTFEKIQYTAPKLNRLEIIRGIAVHHRESLASPAAWACAANLQHVSLTAAGCARRYLHATARSGSNRASAHIAHVHLRCNGQTTGRITRSNEVDYSSFGGLGVGPLCRVGDAPFRDDPRQKGFLSRVWQMAAMREPEALIMAMKDRRLSQR